MAILIEAAGWLGAILVLGAYMLVSSGRVSGKSALFQWMNALGSALFILNTWWHGAIPSMVLNIIWLGIGTVALARIARLKRTRQ
ncbi:hypothetical protein [Sphingobium sp. EM0848]|uniref:CBU_0592 family membrane protein n=1 Tax=Sphingobium sp. EM0848 TaxID=2743473 RepID=UPI00159CAB4F|nr:hypothetical protein [Sphingobium sp. EM0848]